MSPDLALRFGAFELSPASGQLLREGVNVPLRARPLALLQVFLSRPGQLLGKDELLSEAWPGVVVEENNLQVQVSVLRKLLGITAIETLPSRGYRFTMAVHPVNRREAPIALPERSTLLGRDDDMKRALFLLESARLLTLTGAGGVGKTSIARSLTRGRREARWVDLAELSDAALLPAYVLDRLPAAAPAGDDALAALQCRLSGSPCLLVLDNAEHLIEATALMVDRLLQSTDTLQVLVTSQAPLRLPGEHVLRLLPLALPDAGASVEAASRSGAVALFMQRVQALCGHFVLDDSTLGDVIEICRRLDGLPLALELASARVPTLGLRNLAALLDERFRLLNTGHRQAPHRQQTLQALFDWSHALLDASEQRMFRRLGVLSGGRTLAELGELLRLPDDAAIDLWHCYDSVAAMVERSLLRMDDGDPPRYTMLESARDYALTKLREAGERALIEHASGWYERAGDRSAESAGGTRAVVEYSHALELLRFLPMGAERDHRELRLNLKVGPALQSTLGPSHARCESVYRRSVELARGAAPGPEPFQALWGYWQYLTLAGRDREAAPYAAEIAEMATCLEDDGLQLEALHAEMTTADLLGDAPTVVAHAEAITARYDRCRHHRLTFAFGGHDPGVCALGQGSVNHWLCGRSGRAVELAGMALALAASLDHGYSRATGAYYAAITFALVGDTAALARTADALVSLSDEFGMAMLLTEGRFFQGRARFERGDAQGLVEMGEYLHAIEAARDLGFIFVYMALYAEALLRAERSAEVVPVVDRGLGHARLGQGLLLPELLRLRALARRAAGDVCWRDDAHEARRMAEAQGAIALVARAQQALNLDECRMVAR